MAEATIPGKGSCAICEEALGVEPHFVLDQGPHGEHVRCMAAAARPFPYGPKIEAMRRAYRRLRLHREPPEALAVIEAAGKALRALEEAWPEAFDPAMDREATELVSEAEGLLTELKRQRQRASLPAGWMR